MTIVACPICGTTVNREASRHWPARHLPTRAAAAPRAPSDNEACKLLVSARFGEHNVSFGTDKGFVNVRRHTSSSEAGFGDNVLPLLVTAPVKDDSRASVNGLAAGVPPNASDAERTPAEPLRTSSTIAQSPPSSCRARHLQAAAVSRA